MKRFLLSSLLLLSLLCVPAQGMEVEISVSHFRPNLMGDYMPGHLMDNNATTAWASSALNNGVGSWFQIDFPEVVALKSIAIANGHQGGQFQGFARIRSGRFVFSDGTKQHFELQDSAGVQKVDCWAVPTMSIRVLVDSIYPEEPGKSMSLAVSEVKFVIFKGVDVPTAMPENGMLGELADVIRDFYTRQTTLDDGFLVHFPRDTFQEEQFGFEVFKQMQIQLGTHDALKQSVVNTDDLKFRLMKYEDGVAEVHCYGHYSATLGDKIVGIPDDSVFTMKREDGAWKIFGIRDYASVE